MARRDTDLMKSVQHFGQKWTLFRVSTDCIPTGTTGSDPKTNPNPPIPGMLPYLKLIPIKNRNLFFIFVLIVKTVLQKSDSVEMRKRA